MSTGSPQHLVEADLLRELNRLLLPLGGSVANLQEDIQDASSLLTLLAHYNIQGTTKFNRRVQSKPLNIFLARDNRQKLCQILNLHNKKHGQSKVFREEDVLVDHVLDAVALVIQIVRQGDELSRSEVDIERKSVEIAHPLFVQGGCLHTWSISR
eukprot:TRINITY_DN19439_c0_g1_i1.p1 TRINITY_DN19439_c0_g1~~TRINITY_DN19439_c0_g1_i1.p1  ORF type:complete len:155 (+),score=22.37 TRINITY_DN19439_c0_g1_i1:55-519(+)